MSKNRNRRNRATGNQAAAFHAPVSVDSPVAAESKSKAVAFSFGDAEAVLDRREIFDLFESPLAGRFYEPPVSQEGLGRMYRAAVHHSSALQVKAGVLSSLFIEHKLLTRSEFYAWVLNYLTFGNGYLERVGSMIGTPVKLRNMLARYTRRGADLDSYWWCPNFRDETPMKKGSVFHLMEPDLAQEVYGVPYYLAAMHSTLLNESATLFRRRYYLNGSHAGFILYMTDAAQKDEDIEALRQALKDSKGPGNFRNLFMYAPNGKKDGIQLIPVAEVAAKDEFINIKNITRDDMMAMHRVPPQLMGILPGTNVTFGDAEKAAAIFDANELEPLRKRFMELNTWMGEEVVSFEPYSLAVLQQPAGSGTVMR